MTKATRFLLAILGLICAIVSIPIAGLPGAALGVTAIICTAIVLRNLILTGKEN